MIKDYRLFSVFEGGVCNEYKIDHLQCIEKEMRVRVVGIIRARCEYEGEHRAEFGIPSLAPRKLALSQGWDDRGDSCQNVRSSPTYDKAGPAG